MNLFITFFILFTTNIYAETVTLQDTICGFRANEEQLQELLFKVNLLVKEKCIQEGHQDGEIINYSFIVKPYAWGTIDCTPLSKLIINGEKNCDIDIL